MIETSRNKQFNYINLQKDCPHSIATQPSIDISLQQIQVLSDKQPIHPQSTAPFSQLLDIKDFWAFQCVQ